MSLPSIKNRVGMSVSGTPGTGTITLGSAESGYQSFAAAYAANANVDMLIVDGTAWEVCRDCTYTHSGTTISRGTLEDGSSGTSTRVAFTSAAKVYVIRSAARIMADINAYQGVMPGGRLTLTSGVDITTSDVTGATTIYYTPSVSNVIPLWDGNAWLSILFSETSLSIGTVSSGKPYDVFGYLDAGALALEKLVWTDDTTRATAITIQDGKYCKSGDHSRLYLGSFYTTSTSATEDSETKRYLWNMYNRADKFMINSDGASNTYGHTYSTAGYRKYNNGDYLYLDVVAGLIGSLPRVVSSAQILNVGGPTAQIGCNWIDGSSINTGNSIQNITPLPTGSFTMAAVTHGRLETPAAGRYRLHLVERCATTGGTVTWSYASIRGHYQC